MPGTLVVPKRDRLTRSLLDFQKMLIWCREHGKTIISVSEGIDFEAPAGGQPTVAIVCLVPGGLAHEPRPQ